jgi:hypothetical protein
MGWGDAAGDGGGAVLSFAGSVRVFVALEPCDMPQGSVRKSQQKGEVMVRGWVLRTTNQTNHDQETK